MKLLPLIKPRLGLSITTNSVSLVEIHRSWRDRRLKDCRQQQLPSGVVHLSPAKPNLLEEQTLIHTLNALAQHIPRPVSIALSLSDLCARTAVFEFASFPKETLEQERLLRWRFQQDLNASVNEARLSYRIHRRPPPSSSRHAASESIWVVVTAVQESILEQYERVCLETGLIPLYIGISGFDVLDFYGSTITESVDSMSQQHPMSPHASAFLYLTDWGFTFVVLQENIPTFVRIKALRLPSNDHHGSTTSPRDSKSVLPSDDPTHESTEPPATEEGPAEIETEKERPVSPAVTRMVSNELVATFQYFFETHLRSMKSSLHLPLFFAEGMNSGSSLLPNFQELETTLRCGSESSPHISIVSLPNRLLTVNRSVITQTRPPDLRGLSALAGVMVA